MNDSPSLWTALITPMHEDGSLHLDDLTALLHRQAAAGNGVLLIGSTGEGLALSDSEKLAVVEHAAAQNVSIPLMVGVGGFQLETQLNWIRTCNTLSVDSFLLVAPLYAKPGPFGMEHWFRSLMDAAEKPCMIYNIPSRTGVKIPPSVIAGLSDHPNFWAVKEASGSIEEFQAFRAASPEVPLYSGDDGLTPFFCRAGAVGLVSVASNVWPKATRRYTEYCLSGNTVNTLPIWKPATDALFSASNPIPAKRLLQHKGVIESARLRAPLHATELSTIDHLIEADRHIERWLAENTN
ncbi:MAG: 4-hydroxy-tetrahydrodipicolinate synthase [Balneolaceae bacterium]